MKSKLFVQRHKNDRRKPRIAAIVAMLLCLLILFAALFAIHYAGRTQRNMYKLNYTDEISASCTQNSLDPYLVCAMIFCESSFRSEAVSSVGAIGLMQIMPDTGQWLADRLDMDGYSEQLLRRPSVNIQLGCYYLRFLLDRYGQDWRCAVAAYHSGQGNVDSWLKNSQISPDGSTLVNIPQGETKKYTERVLKTYDIYKKLYWSEFEQQ